MSRRIPPFLQRFSCQLLICLVWLQGLTRQVTTQTVSVRIIAAENNEPLPGVNILLKGTTMGATTDNTGRYNVKVSGDNPTLMFSFIGYVPQQIAVKTCLSLM